MMFTNIPNTELYNHNYFRCFIGGSKQQFNKIKWQTMENQDMTIWNYDNIIAYSTHYLYSLVTTQQRRETTMTTNFKPKMCKWIKYRL